MMRPHHHRRPNYDYEEQEQEHQRRRVAWDMEGTEMTLLEASLVGLGGSPLWVSGTGGKLLRRSMARLPESAANACLVGAAAGALTATGLWVTRRQDHLFGHWRGVLHPLAALGAVIM